MFARLGLLRLHGFVVVFRIPEAVLLRRPFPTVLDAPLQIVVLSGAFREGDDIRIRLEVSPLLRIRVEGRAQLFGVLGIREDDAVRRDRSDDDANLGLAIRADIVLLMTLQDILSDAAVRTVVVVEHHIRRACSL